MQALAGLLIHVFFREVEIENLTSLPPGAPAVVVANHTNGLVDGLLLMATLSRYPRLIAKSTLFSIPPLWPFLKLAGVIPVHRVQDGPPGPGGRVPGTADPGADGPSRNAATFAAAERLLAAGGVVALFPEGISHDQPAVQELRTGAARIALGAAAAGAPGVVTVPVGLAYDDKARFRSRALVRVGPPEPVADRVPGYRADGQAAVRALTDDLAGRLAEVAPNYRSWVDADRLTRLAEIVARSDAPGDPVSLVRREATAEALARTLDREDPDLVAGLWAVFDRYQCDLEILGLSDARLASGRRVGLALELGRALAETVAASPLVVVGVAVHVVPYQVVKRLAARPENTGMRATVKLLGCTAGFAAAYAGLGFAVGRRRGPGAGLAASTLGPVSGLVTLRVAERLAGLGGAAAAAAVLRADGGLLATVRADRARLLERTAALLGSQAVSAGR